MRPWRLSGKISILDKSVFESNPSRFILLGIILPLALGVRERLGSKPLVNLVNQYHLPVIGRYKALKNPLTQR